MQINKINITELKKQKKYNTIIDIDGKVDSLNILLREHWAIRQKILNDLYNLIYFSLLEKNKDFYKYNKVDLLYLIYYFKDNKARDYDNYSGKILIDAIRKTGLIKDDSCKIIKALKIKILNNQVKDKIIISIEGK